MKKYISLRYPSGQRKDRNGSRYSPNALLRYLATHAKVDESGGVSYSGFDILMFLTLFTDRFIISDPDGMTLSAVDHRKVVGSALSSYLGALRGNKQPDVQEFLKVANKACAAYFRRPLKRYAIDSSLSISSFPKKTIQSRGARIQFLRSNPSYEHPTLEKQFRDEAYAEHIKNTQYTWVRVYSTARTANEAVDNANGSLSYIRALWNLLGSYRRWTYRFGLNKFSPKTIVTQGPVQWVSSPISAELKKQHIWVEENWRRDQALFEPQMGWRSLEEDRVWASRRISRSPMRADIQSLLKEYCSALDEISDQNCFLRLWILLERITNTQNGNYEETIKSASSIFQDKHLVRDALKSLRTVRNRIVHADANGIVNDDHNATLKRIVDQHLLWLIHNKLKMASIEEYAAILKIAKSKSEIGKQIKLREKALAFVVHD